MAFRGWCTMARGMAQCAAFLLVFLLTACAAGAQSASQKARVKDVAAIEGIRAVDANGTIGMISAETDRPYNRPPLSKGLWKGDASLDDIWAGPRDSNATLHLGRTARALDPEARQVTDEAW